MITETLTVFRGSTDRMADRVTDSTHTVQGVIAWGGARANARFSKDRTRRESAGVTAELYVKRGTDLQARDRIERSNGQVYIVTGHSLWDQVQPQSGHNFGWMVFQVEASNG